MKLRALAVTTAGDSGGFNFQLGIRRMRKARRMKLLSTFQQSTNSEGLGLNESFVRQVALKSVQITFV